MLELELPLFPEEDKPVHTPLCGCDTFYIQLDALDWDYQVVLCPYHKEEERIEREAREYNAFWR